MASQPRLVLHSVPFSHPVLAVSTALDRLGYEYETVELVTGQQAEEVEKVYGEGRRTVPGLLVDDEPVHGTAPIFARLDALNPDAGLYPTAVAEQIREIEPGLAEDIQMSARVLVFGAMHFRPESMGTFAGIEQLDPGGVDFAIKSMRAAWRYLGISAERAHATLQELPGQLDPGGVDFAIKSMRAAWRYLGITAERAHATLQELPGQLDAVDALLDAGAIGGDRPTAADFQLGSSLHLLVQIGDVRPLVEERPAARLLSLFEPGKGNVSAGAFPPGWVPAARS